MDIERCLRLAREEHYCPHCKGRLSCCEAPPFHIGDGLGWGSDVLFICLNDHCTLFTGSWDKFEERYGHNASCRYILLPGEDTGMAMMVGGAAAFTGSVIDPEAIAAQNERYRREMAYTEQLEDSVAENRLKPALGLLLDDRANPKTRLKACEILEALGDVTCIDPIRNHKFAQNDIEMRANLAIKQILKKNHQRECPYCAELVKAQARLCKHCNKEL